MTYDEAVQDAIKKLQAYYSERTKEDLEEILGSLLTVLDGRDVIEECEELDL